MPLLAFFVQPFSSSCDKCDYPEHCLHSISIHDSTLLQDELRYDIPNTLPIPEFRELQQRVSKLLHLHVHPDILLKCGCTAEILAICGVRISDLVHTYKYKFTILAKTFKFSPEQLRLLRFSATLCKGNDAFPVFVLTELGYDWKYVCSDWSRYMSNVFNGEELIALGCTYNIMHHIGMSEKHLQHIRDTLPERRTVAWFNQHFGCD